MVQVRALHPTHADGNVDIQAWMAGLQSEVELADTNRLQKACELAQKVRDHASKSEDIWATAEVDCFRTGLEMAEILTALQVNEET